MNAKKILITGGAGFVGSNLCASLLEQGHEVLCLDNFYTGSMRNIAPLLKNPRFKLIEKDVMLPFYEEADQIYNLACPASPIHYQKDPVRTIRTSFLGTQNCLELAKKCGATVLQASTSEVYGDPEVHPQSESYRGCVNTLGIRACYDEGKRCAETLMMDYHRQYGVDVKIVRIFNTYGPNMEINDGRVISNFIVQALKNQDITMYGDGLQTRSFQYVDDLVRGIQMLMNSPRGFIGPVNIGNDTETTLQELAVKIIALTNAKSKIIYKPLPEDDPKRRKPDMALARKELNYLAKVSLEEGLRKTVEYFRTIVS
ncbi:MAG: SDR family oxidoreductase [Bacteroidaceae bacterium]|nr:SDR family oxidoreductase [Bacteroidaceae bacterium]MBP9637463.1 SDR family oxidoreductase [Bacteroidaceae bacterium]